jgi:RimJ/RimL family protein N-acetyltransferase
LALRLLLCCGNAVTAATSLLTPAATWRAELPTLGSRLVSLREPTPRDAGDLLVLLSVDDAPRFGTDEPISAFGVQRLIERAARDRSLGIGFTYAITLNGSRRFIGLVQTRQLDPAFEGAEWECVIHPSFRGQGAFLEAVRLAGSFAFGTVGCHRLEARVWVANGRGNGALRKLGAVQEGLLRRSLRRGGAYHDQVLWSMLRDDWGENWIPTGPRIH